MEKIKSDKELILKFLKREYKDDHPSIYIYCCGQLRSRTTAVMSVSKYLNVIFEGCFNNEYLKKIIIDFLDNKKLQYKNGEIKVKSLY